MKKVFIALSFMLLFSFGASGVHAESNNISNILAKVRTDGYSSGDYKGAINKLKNEEKKLYTSWRQKEVEKNDKEAEKIINRTGTGYYSKILQDGTKLEYAAIDEKDSGESINDSSIIDIQNKIDHESKNHVKKYGNRQYTYTRKDTILGNSIQVYVHQTKYNISTAGLKLTRVLTSGTFHYHGEITGKSILRIKQVSQLGKYLASDIAWHVRNDVPFWGAQTIDYTSTADIKILKWDKKKKNMIVQQRASFNS